MKPNYKKKSTRKLTEGFFGAEIETVVILIWGMIGGNIACTTHKDPTIGRNEDEGEESASSQYNSVLTSAEGLHSPEHLM